MGFFKEQWNNIYEYSVTGEDDYDIFENYRQALLAAREAESLQPMGHIRLRQHKNMLRSHCQTYHSLLSRL